MKRYGQFGTAGVACALLCSTLWATDVAAQDLAAAEALFRKGLEEMEAGKYETGCPAIAESLRLDPRAGTLFTLAECEAAAGKIATAVARYQDYLELYARMSPQQQSKQLGREKIAEEKKRALAPQLPMLTIVLPAGAPAGTTVQRDSVQLAGPALGVALPVDPGDHTIRVTYPGGAATEKKVKLQRGQQLTVELEPGPPAPDTRPTATASATAAPVTAPSAAVDVGPDKGPSGRRIAAYGVAGLGVVGLAVGAVTGALVFDKKGVIEENCAGLDCNKAGKDAADSGKTLAAISTAGFAVGAAGLVTGVVLWLTEPRAQTSSKPAKKVQASIAAGDRTVGLTVTGSW